MPYIQPPPGFEHLLSPETKRTMDEYSALARKALKRESIGSDEGMNAWKNEQTAYYGSQATKPALAHGWQYQDPRVMQPWTAAAGYGPLATAEHAGLPVPMMQPYTQGQQYAQVPRGYATRRQRITFDGVTLNAEGKVDVPKPWDYISGCEYWAPAEPVEPVGYRAPFLNPRQTSMHPAYIPQQTITPPATPQQPVAPPQPDIYGMPAGDEARARVHSAFAGWYVEQVHELMITPGHFRPGVGGAGEEVWGLSGREKAGWLRVGRSPPDYSDAWGRMGMTTPPQPLPRVKPPRNPSTERQDPYNITWHNDHTALIAFTQEVFQRMSISPSAIVAAVWFLKGLGLHEGDGDKGTDLRELLRSMLFSGGDSIATEKRVVTLGLLLAGKWMDDNSFLTRSWCEVTSIPSWQIDLLETAALKDLHYSLFIPHESWVKHLRSVYKELYAQEDSGKEDYEVWSAKMTLVYRMTLEASEVTSKDRSTPLEPGLEFEKRKSVDIAPTAAAADQAIERDWGKYVRPYTHTSRATSPTRLLEEICNQASSLSHPVPTPNNDPIDDIEEVEEEDEDEFLDYDGAKRWLPSMSELRRSASNSSAETIANVQTWRAGVKEEISPTPSPVHQIDLSYQKQSHPMLPQEPLPRQEQPGYTSQDLLNSILAGTGVYLEPGISVVRPVHENYPVQNPNPNESTSAPITITATTTTTITIDQKSANQARYPPPSTNTHQYHHHNDNYNNNGNNRYHQQSSSYGSSNEIPSQYQSRWAAISSLVQGTRGYSSSSAAYNSSDRSTYRSHADVQAVRPIGLSSFY